MFNLHGMIGVAIVCELYYIGQIVCHTVPSRRTCWHSSMHWDNT